MRYDICINCGYPIQRDGEHEWKHSLGNKFYYCCNSYSREDHSTSHLKDELASPAGGVAWITEESE